MGKRNKTTDGHGFTRINAEIGLLRGLYFGVRWQSVAATPLFDCGPSSQSGVALRFPPQSKKIWLQFAAPYLCTLALNFLPWQKIQLSARPPPAHFNPMTQPPTPLLSEPGPIRVLKIICILVCVLSVSCVRAGEGSPGVLSVTNAPTSTTSPEFTNQSGSNNVDQAALDAGLKKAAKMREDRIRGVPQPPSQFPLPNYDTGPQRPYPIQVNLYDIDDHYPDYLLCQYDVDVKNYSQSDEPKWFKASLNQIRRLGSQKFPSLKWIAVIIYNRGDYKDKNTTFEQCTKVGAIFKASDVFDSSRDLSQLVANIAMDRHPFFLDPQRSKYIPAEQQRWMIVERHAATNLPTAGSH